MPHKDSASAQPALRAAVVFNPTKVDVEAMRAAAAKEPSTRGWAETLWFGTTAEDPGQGQTREALEAGASLIIVAGGDGTVRAAAEALDGSGAALAIVPSGTGNLLARNLKLTLDDLPHSIHTAFGGTDLAIDLARIEIRRPDESVTKHAFVVMAGLGLDAKMLAATDDELKKKVGWLAYVQAMIVALRDTDQLRLRLSLDGGRVNSVRAHTLIIGNCGLLTGNIQLLPDATLDDGLFDIVLMRPESFLGWLQILAKILWENGVLRRVKGGKVLMTKDVHALRYLKGRALTVRLNQPEEIEIDGDNFGKATAIKTEIVPGGLTVRVPLKASA